MEYVIGALQRKLTRASLPFNPALVETVTFETETWLKFRDETETSSETPRPRLEI